MTNDSHKLPPPGCGKPAGRPRACDLEARTHDLISTAGTLFLQHGYIKVSLEMIAREAHVAVRTIYVKFGGKAGLLKAVMETNRERYLSMYDMETDTRPFKEIVGDFGRRFFDLVTAAEAINMQRMVLVEAPGNPELAQTYSETGPQQVRAMLRRFFARPDIRSQIRDEVPLDLLPVHLINCILGDHFSRFLFEPEAGARERSLRDLDQRVALFCHGVLRAG
jgi:TetR/AcrR family transcriptional repressor of mexJK operon